MRNLLIRSCDAVYSNYRCMVHVWNAFYDALESSALGPNYARVICYDVSMYAYAPKTVIVDNTNFLWLCLMWFLKFVMLLHVDAYLRHGYVERMLRHLEETEPFGLIYEYRTARGGGGGSKPFLSRRPVMHPGQNPPPAESAFPAILSACVEGGPGKEVVASVTDRMQALMPRTEDTFTAGELAVVLTGGAVRFPRSLVVVWESGDGDFSEREFLANDDVTLAAHGVDDLD